MQIATWNLNNRVGKVKFRPEAAKAAIALGADLLVLTEYFPKHAHADFVAELQLGGYTHTLISPEPRERANRVLIASRHPMSESRLNRPTFDDQFPANLLAVDVQKFGLRVIGLRVPAYEPRDQSKLTKSWEWLTQTAGRCCEEPTVILGDLNVRAGNRPKGVKTGAVFPEIIGTGWTRHQPEGAASFFGHGGFQSEIDHLLTTGHCSVRANKYVTAAGGFVLAGSRDAISDHAALVAEIHVATTS